MKILNLYAGIGGNRMYWNDCQVTAVEWDQKIADVYKKLYPQDDVFVGDAHEYLLQNRNEFDAIWSSPPCPTHSDIRRMAVQAGCSEAKYPDMGLYQEIILLKYFFKGLWVVENVKPYYDSLIQAIERGRHLFWSNFYIPVFDQTDQRLRHNNIHSGSTVYGISLREEDVKDKRKVLRNMVNPDLGLHVFKAMKSASCAKKLGQKNDAAEGLQTAYNRPSMPALQTALEL